MQKKKKNALPSTKLKFMIYAEDINFFVGLGYTIYIFYKRKEGL